MTELIELTDEQKLELEKEARDYVLKLQEEGFKSFACFDCEFAKETAGFRKGVPENEFFDKVEKAYKDGFLKAIYDVIEGLKNDRPV